MFTSVDIRSRIQNRPFVPFQIITSSGEKYKVTHPDLVLVGKRDVIVGKPYSKDPTIYDGVDRLSLMHITAMEDLPLPQTPSGNGQ